MIFCLMKICFLKHSCIESMQLTLPAMIINNQKYPKCEMVLLFLRNLRSFKWNRIFQVEIINIVVLKIEIAFGKKHFFIRVSGRILILGAFQTILSPFNSHLSILRGFLWKIWVWTKTMTSFWLVERLDGYARSSTLFRAHHFIRNFLKWSEIV